MSPDSKAVHKLSARLRGMRVQLRRAVILLEHQLTDAVAEVEITGLMHQIAEASFLEEARWCAYWQERNAVRDGAIINMGKRIIELEIQLGEECETTHILLDENARMREALDESNAENRSYAAAPMNIDIDVLQAAILRQS